VNRVSDFACNVHQHHFGTRKVIMNVFRKTVLLTIALTLLYMSAKAQSVVSTIPLGHAPTSLAVNPKTNLVYATDRMGYKISVVDGATNVLKTTIPLGFQPEVVSVNPTTNRIYVSGSYFDGLVVLDGATNSVQARIPLAPWFTEIEINSVTNQVYVGNPDNRTITVIDGNVGSPTENTVVAIIPLPIYGGGDIAVNEVTNRVYIGTSGFDFQTHQYFPITVLDGSTNTISAKISFEEVGSGVAVNPRTNTVYVVGPLSYRLWVVDANTNTVSASIDLDEHVNKVAVNPTTNRVHLTNVFGGVLVIVDGATNTYLNRMWLGTYEPGPMCIAVNPKTSYVYTGNIGWNPSFGGQSISVIDDPPSPAEQIQGLIDLVKTYNLANGIANSLDAKLQNALGALDSVNNGNNSTACNKMASFINEVESHQQLSTVQATELINAANRIRRTLGCG